ncbi:conserved hypothetical protein, partial [Ricinus communis]
MRWRPIARRCHAPARGSSWRSRQPSRRRRRKACRRPATATPSRLAHCLTPPAAHHRARISPTAQRWSVRRMARWRPCPATAAWPRSSTSPRSARRQPPGHSSADCARRSPAGAPATGPGRHPGSMPRQTGTAAGQAPATASRAGGRSAPAAPPSGRATDNSATRPRSPAC